MLEGLSTYLPPYLENDNWAITIRRRERVKEIVKGYNTLNKCSLIHLNIQMAMVKDCNLMN